MILAVKEYWQNSQMSVARHYGGIRIQGTQFVIVNRYGKTVFETSIDAYEPADLIDERYIKLYKMYGRQAFLDLLYELKHEPTLTEMKRLLAERYPSESAKKKQAPKNEELELPL